MLTFKDTYNNEDTLTLYSGNVYVSKGIIDHGGNVCYRTESGDFVVIAYLDKEQSQRNKLDRSILNWCRAYGSSAIQL